MVQMNTPDTQSDPDFIPAQAAGSDPDFIPAQTQANPYDPDTFMGNVRGSIEEGKGIIKGVGRTAAGLLDVYAKSPGGVVPGVAPGTVDAARTAADWLHQHTQLNNAQQVRGNVAETIAEFAGPALLERLGLAGVAAAGEAGNVADAAEAAPKVSESLTNLAKKAKIFEEHPDIHAAVQKGLQAIQSTAPGRITARMAGGAAEGAARGATEQGAQTFVKSGGDPEATIDAMKTGATWGGGAGALIPGGAQTLREVATAIDNARPIELGLAGANFPARAGGKSLNMPPLNEVPVDPVTSAVDAASGNIGKTAVANSLARSIAERAPEPTVIPPSRRLPGGGGIAIPGPGEPTPTGEGQIAFEPGKQQIGTRVVEGKGPGKFNLPRYQGEEPPPTGEGDLTQQGSHREPIYQYRNAPKPGTEGNVVTDTPMGGPGNLILTADGQGLSVMRARQQLAQWDRILNDDDIVNEMGVREHGQLVGARQDLSEQLNRYDDFAAKQNHFPAPDIRDAVANTTSLGEAGDLLKATHGPFWDKADELTARGGDEESFSDLRDEEKRLEKQIYGPNPTGKLDDLRQQLANNQQKQMDFFDKYRTQVSPQEWDTARSGYQDGIVLKNLHNLIESNFNGITRAETQARPSLQRVFQPGNNFNSQLEDFYNGGFRNSATNREVLQRTIGNDHMLDLKQMGQLFENSERRGATKSLMDNISANVRRHGWAVSGLGGAAGYGLAHAAGTVAGVGAETVLPTVAGVVGVPLLKGTVTGTLHHITDRIATDPDFLKRFTYAVLNKIPPRTAGPILAARIGATLQNQKNQNPEEQ